MTTKNCFLLFIFRNGLLKELLYSITFHVLISIRGLYRFPLTRLSMLAGPVHSGFVVKERVAYLLMTVMFYFTTAVSIFIITDTS